MLIVDMDLHLDDHSVLVTASSSGLGLATAKAFAREGAHVAICARDEHRLADAHEQVEAAGDGSVFSTTTDLTDKNAVEELLNAVVAEFGGLDHLVTSAGRTQFGPFENLETEDWYDAFDILVMSAVWTIDAARPHLDDSDAGTVVTITSASVAEPMMNLTLSNAVRRSVLGLTKNLADDLAPSIRVNSVLPYHHVSEEDLADASEDAVEGWISDIPLNRVGDPNRLGDVCAFLSSDRANFIHGASIPLDGGWLRG